MPTTTYVDAPTPDQLADKLEKKVAKEDQNQGTRYVILRRTRTASADDASQNSASTPRTEQWEKITEIAAASAESALRKAAAHPHVSEAETSTLISGGQMLVAVPARSWQPVTVTVETKTTVRLS